MRNENESGLRGFLGGSPLAVALYLIVMSIIVGIVLNAFGITPAELLERVLRFARNVWELGFEAFGKFGEWFLVGAVIVVPIWFISRLFRSNR